MSLLKDTVSNVKTLAKKVKTIIRNCSGENKELWCEFYKECKSFLRSEKKRLERKYKALRFAASEAPKNLHEALQANCQLSKEVAKQMLIGNWEGYLIWVEKEFRNADYSNQQYLGGSCWTGKYYEAIIDTKTLKKVAMLFKKAFFPNAKITIKMGYKEFMVRYKNLEDRKAANEISDFINQFSYNFSNSMVDYFSRGYDSDTYIVS